MPRAEGSLWDLNLGLANVPALPTSGEKDFMKLLIQLLAATFQARLCPTKCPCLMLQTQWSNKKKLGSDFQHLVSAGNHACSICAFAEDTGKCRFSYLEAAYLCDTDRVSCVPGQPPAPSLAHSECRNTPLLGANSQQQRLKTWNLDLMGFTSSR